MQLRTRNGFPTLALALAGGLALPVSALADNFTWNGASGGGWSVQANWRQNNAAARRLPNAGDDVTITTGAGTPKQVIIDQAPDGANNVVISIKSLTVSGPITMNIKADNNVLRKKVYFGVQNGVTIGAAAVIDPSRGGMLNADGCDLEINSTTAAVTVNGTVRGGTPVGTGGRGGDVKIVSGIANGTGVTVTGLVQGGPGTANTVSRGGNVVIQSNTGAITVRGNACGVVGGRGSDNNAGNGGAGGSVDLRTARPVTLGAAADVTECVVKGGAGGEGKALGGRGGDVSIGTAGQKVQELTLAKVVAVSGGKGGRTTDAEDAQRRAVLGLGGDGGNVSLFVAGTLVNNYVILGGGGGGAAIIERGDTRGKAGNGGNVSITANAVTNDGDGSILGGGPDQADYSGRGGDVTITCGAGNFLNHGYISGASGQGDSRLSLRSGNGDNRVLSGAGGKVTITGDGNFQNVRKNGFPAPTIKGGDGGGAVDDQNTLQGPGWPGGDVDIRFDARNVTNGGAINPGKHGAPNPQKLKSNLKLKGANVDKIGFLGKNLDGTDVAAHIEVQGHQSITIQVGDEAHGETVSLSTDDGGTILFVNPFPNAHGKLRAEERVSLNAGPNGTVDLRQVNGREGGEYEAIIVQDEDFRLGRIEVTPAFLDDDCTCDDVIGLIFVGCPADYNGDGFVDFFDYDDFIACFEGLGCPSGKTADFNGDGFADFFDYDDFVSAFETGC